MNTVSIENNTSLLINLFVTVCDSMGRSENFTRSSDDGKIAVLLMVMVTFASPVAQCIESHLPQFTPSEASSNRHFAFCCIARSILLHSASGMLHWGVMLLLYGHRVMMAMLREE